MSTQGIFDSTIQVLDKVLELRTRKLEVISSNIANAETPGYAAQRMDFEKDLQEAISASGTKVSVTHPRHIATGSGGDIGSFQADVYREEDKSGLGDKNSVSLDQEMVDMSRNQIRFEAAIRSLNKKFSMLKMVIQERV
ncbi:MAG: flagellar basal body rod protein FlgB [Desulfohalobiaceae bacterium]|nr:flagellar basal body rod protein FlgB [Desulfohalobiaceae bacterium]